MDNYIKKIIYLGPNGSNSQFASALFMEKLGIKAQMEGVSTITKAIEILNDEDEFTLGVLPVENSIEGIVRETADNFVKSDPKLSIQAEISIPIRHCLISKGKKEEIKTIVSITQAIAQCKNYISKNFGNDINILLYTSTSAAAKFVKSKDNSYGAIASELCAKLYGLNVVEAEINDLKDNQTRFIAVCKKKLIIKQNVRTSLAFTTNNRPGALLEILEVFKKYNLNLIYLESRPSKKIFGEYIFYVDIDKPAEEIDGALDEIGQKCTYWRLLGSYPVL